MKERTIRKERNIEWMSELTNELISEWKINERMDEWINEWMNGSKNEWIKERYLLNIIWWETKKNHKEVNAKWQIVWVRWNKKLNYFIFMNNVFDTLTMYLLNLTFLIAKPFSYFEFYLHFILNNFQFYLLKLIFI